MFQVYRHIGVGKRDDNPSTEFVYFVFQSAYLVMNFMSIYNCKSRKRADSVLQNDLPCKAFSLNGIED